MFSKDFDTATILAEHALFHGGMEEMSDYLTSCLPIGTVHGYDNVVKASSNRASGEPLVNFDGQKLRAIIDSFVAVFVSHVRFQISIVFHALTQAITPSPYICGS